MISISKMGGGQERYYLEKVAEGAEDYYSGEGEAGATGSVTPPPISACKARWIPTS